MHPQKQVGTMLSASAEVAKVIHWESVSTDLMTTGRSPGQHQGTSRTREQEIQGTIIIFLVKIETRQQARFDERFNRQYLPNYNNYQPSPIGFIPGQGLSATLIELANIQSRSLEIMAANQRSQQEAFSELTKASKDKANDAMFASIISLGLFLLQGTAVFTAFIEEYPKYSFYSDLSIIRP